MKTAIVLLAFIATTILTALVLTPMHWPFGLLLWALVVTVSLLVVVRWHARNTMYRCPECDHLFSISTFTDLVSPHGLGRGGGWKLLTCPKCGHHKKAKVYLKDDSNKGT